MSTVEPIVARKMHRTLEPYHGVVYFSPEAAARYRALGLADRQMGYFASRAAAMGPVPGEVVVATFFNFAPAEVLRCIPAAWDRATPAAVLEARLAGIDETLRRIIGDDLDGAGVAEAADLARTATEACTAEGRPLYAGHRSLPWPDPPHLVLWHALSLLREHRGDGHVAALLHADLSGIEALI
ncbi:MAG: SCO6745 family protein, partial [Acidimicrobiales bacterium]